MSKTIDRSDLSALSQEDLEYLRARGQLSAGEELEYLGGSPVTAPEGIPLEERPHTGDEGPELDEERVAREVEMAESGMVPGTSAAPGAEVTPFGAAPPSRKQRSTRAARSSEGDKDKGAG